jgi:predicted secreted protein
MNTTPVPPVVVVEEEAPSKRSWKRIGLITGAATAVLLSVYVLAKRTDESPLDTVTDAVVE